MRHSPTCMRCASGTPPAGGRGCSAQPPLNIGLQKPKKSVCGFHCASGVKRVTRDEDEDEVGAEVVYLCGKPAVPRQQEGWVNRLIRTLEPLFRKYGVEAYFAGHEHQLQHLNRCCKGDGIDAAVPLMTCALLWHSAAGLSGNLCLPGCSYPLRMPPQWNSAPALKDACAHPAHRAHLV